MRLPGLHVLLLLLLLYIQLLLLLFNCLKLQRKATQHLRALILLLLLLQAMFRRHAGM
jgi:hypothetical protein